MMFSDLSAECEQMWEDLNNEYVPKYFDLFFAAVGKRGMKCLDTMYMSMIIMV